MPRGITCSMPTSTAVLRKATAESTEVVHIHKTNQKLRDIYRAIHNPRTRIYGTNIRNFD
jgi:hypothetical protein